MSQTVIQVEHLGKKYQLGAQSEPYGTLRESLVRFGSTPLRVARRVFRAPTAVSRPEFWALDDINFDVALGDVLGIVGHNGSGKSTLLKLLSRITEPTVGRITIQGRIASLLEVGTGFHPELTGRENIYLNGAILGMPRTEIVRKFDEIVAFAEVEQFIDTLVKYYSSGMYLRLAFSVAAHLEPEILIVDEVLAVGDAAFQKKCLGKMSEVSKHGRTVLFVSHNTSAILSLCTRCLLLRRGELIAEGTPTAVINTYIGSLTEQTVGEDLSQISTLSRRGRGQVRFTRFAVEDAAGEPLHEVPSGTECYLRIAYEGSIPGSLFNCRVDATIYDLMGQYLFNCTTEVAREEELRLPQAGTLRCRIPRFPLSVGRYLVTLYFEVNHEIEDWIESGLTISVCDASFFPGARQYAPGHYGKGVLIAHEWLI